jgi:hypothetical protein
MRVTSLVTLLAGAFAKLPCIGGAHLLHLVTAPVQPLARVAAVVGVRSLAHAHVHRLSGAHYSVGAGGALNVGAASQAKG